MDDILKNKQKIKNYRLSTQVSEIEVRSAKFDLVEKIEKTMHKKMVRLIESEMGQKGLTIIMNKSQKNFNDEIILTLDAEVYE